jgi:6-pyruvoyltetrahydropterin/6-carboxytetrahydropterin synthase
MSEHLLFTAATPFEAARRLSLAPETHRSRRLHGHSFLAKIRVAGNSAWANFPGDEVVALRRHLVQAVAPLDYADLNRTLDQPTDENLARWVRERLNLPEIYSVGIQSTPYAGVDLDHRQHAHVWRRYVFHSAHQLPKVAPGHKCGRMHGHGFEVILHADHGPQPRQSSSAHDRLDQLWAPLHAELDHACLNDIPGLENPTSEMICMWLWRRLEPALPELSSATVYETATCGAHFDGRDYRIWKDSALDSALRLTRAPVGDPRRRIHGHTYTLRLHLHAPLDEIMGWTIDFGDVKDRFTPIFLELDHRPLHELLHDRDPDVATLANWIRQATTNVLPQLERVDLYETPGCGAILSWGNSGPVSPI